VFGGEYQDLKARVLLEEITSEIEPLIPYEVASGDQISFFVACVCLFLVIIVLPSLFYYVLVACDLDTINSEEFEERFGPLIDGLRTDRKIYLTFYLSMVVRRFLFCALTLMDTTCIQVLLLIIINLAYAIYVTNLRAYKMGLLNQSIIVNEFFVGMITVSMLVFTDYVQDEDAKYEFAFFVVGLVVIIIVYNMWYFLGYGIKLIVLLIIKGYKRVNAKLCKKKETEEVLESSSSSEE